ncbi:MAG: hypothetical protein GOV15_00245, partial [Candidatus Diapherotrites archaeon]|nr:hypothetical protein [Candidatus Diapherotrites archaeon]
MLKRTQERQPDAKITLHLKTMNPKTGEYDKITRLKHVQKKSRPDQLYVTVKRNDRGPMLESETIKEELGHYIPKLNIPTSNLFEIRRKYERRHPDAEVNVYVRKFNQSRKKYDPGRKIKFREKKLAWSSTIEKEFTRLIKEKDFVERKDFVQAIQKHQKDYGINFTRKELEPYWDAFSEIFTDKFVKNELQAPNQRRAKIAWKEVVENFKEKKALQSLFEASKKVQAMPIATEILRLPEEHQAELLKLPVEMQQKVLSDVDTAATQQDAYL